MKTGNHFIPNLTWSPVKPLNHCGSFQNVHFTQSSIGVRLLLNHQVLQHSALPQWFNSKESACNPGNTGNVGLIPWSGRSPGEEHGHPLQYSCLEKSHGQRSLVGYSPWGYKELNTTVQTHACMHNQP